MEFTQLIARAQYAELERAKFGAAWTNEELALCRRCG
jgi:hypothetical protein